MLAFSLIPECMLIPPVRDEEDLEDLYTDDFFEFMKEVLIYYLFYLIVIYYVNYI